MTEKINNLKQEIGDSTLQNLVKSDELWIENNKKKLLFWALRNKITPIVYALVRIK